jgi:hypothetical protein
MTARLKSDRKAVRIVPESVGIGSRETGLCLSQLEEEATCQTFSFLLTWYLIASPWLYRCDPVRCGVVAVQYASRAARESSAGLFTSSAHIA